MVRRLGMSTTSNTSLGSAGMLAVLAAIGYVANEAQSGASLVGIALLQTAIPGLFALLAVLVTRFYSLSGPQLDQIQRELDRRGSHVQA